MSPTYTTFAASVHECPDGLSILKGVQGETPKNRMGGCTFVQPP